MATPGRLRLLLFALPMLVYLLGGPVFYGWDGEIMYRVSESLVLHHSIQIVDPIYHFAQPYSPYGIGTSLLLIPLVAAGQWLLHDPRALVILFLPTVTALTVLALQALLRELGASWTRATMLALLYAFGTLAWHYAGVLFSEPVVALCLTCGLLFSLRFQASGQARWLVAAGAFSGLALLTREDSAFLLLPPLAAYAGWLLWRRLPLWRPRINGGLAYGLPILAAGLVALAYHLVRFGTGAGPYAHDGIGFAEPLLSGLYGLLLSPGAGLLVYVPVLALGLIGFRSLLQRARGVGMVIAAVVVLRLLFYARWWDWGGGATWGPRYLVPLIPLLLVPVAFVFGARWRVATIVLGMAGVGIEVLGQLVPYGRYYAEVVPDLVAGLGYCHCAPRPGQASRALNNLMAFDWHYAPLVGQFRDLANGAIAPSFAPIVMLVFPLMIGVALAIWRACRLAAALDAAIPAPSGSRPARESAA